MTAGGRSSHASLTSTHIHTSQSHRPVAQLTRGSAIPKDRAKTTGNSPVFKLQNFLVVEEKFPEMSSKFPEILGMNYSREFPLGPCVSGILHWFICSWTNAPFWNTPYPGKRGPPKQNAVKCTVYNTIKRYIHSII